MSWLRINGRPKAICVEILENVQFIGETLPKFRQKVSVFSKWARHRGDVRNFKGFVPGFGKIRAGPFRKNFPD
ncbi:hypothetical protein Prudu_021228 [Prunus dulcis]|uniref:Uncharacterized protein n=1 Tax=Prunus dulcis TaxID=3755 RepID=A0A4Y1RX04_PRUDU|nr:hypothetical protein Prudu_021228 [Prunus dulcis]